MAVGATLSFDFSAFPELSALEVVLYDYDEAQRIGKLPDGVITPPCAPPGGTASLCLLERIAGPADPPLLFDLPALKPGHYAVIVRANFGSGMQRGYTEQGFNLVVSG